MLDGSPARPSAHMVRIGFARSRFFPLCCEQHLQLRVQLLGVYDLGLAAAMLCRRPRSTGLLIHLTTSAHKCHRLGPHWSCPLSALFLSTYDSFGPSTSSSTCGDVCTLNRCHAHGVSLPLRLWTMARSQATPPERVPCLQAARGKIVPPLCLASGSGE